MQELLSFLQKHRPWLQNLLSDSLGKGLEGSAVQTTEAALLSSLIAALLKCCDPEVRSMLCLRSACTMQTCTRHALLLSLLPPRSRHVLQAGSSDVAAQQAAQVCLGLLGAVDPTRVSMPPPPASCLLPSDLALLVHLIERHLVRVLRVSAHLHQLDAAVYSIQVRQSSWSAAVPAGMAGYPTVRCCTWGFTLTVLLGVQELLRHYSSTGIPMPAGVVLLPSPGGAAHGINPAAGNTLFAALSADTQASAHMGCSRCIAATLLCLQLFIEDMSVLL